MSKRKTDTQEKRLAKAMTDLRKIEEDIAPFVNRRHYREYSTAGEWRETESITEAARNSAVKGNSIRHK
jgi:hypothetical protein